MQLKRAALRGSDSTSPSGEDEKQKRGSGSTRIDWWTLMTSMRILRKRFGKNRRRTFLTGELPYCATPHTACRWTPPSPRVRCYLRFMLIRSLHPGKIWSANYADDLIR